MVAFARAVVSMALMAVALSASSQRTHAVRQFPDFSRILVVAAHPDDELLVAPMLGLRCAEGSSRCSLLLFTRGENGPCAIASGCGPDLGHTRSAEAAKSAALLNVQLEIWEFPDVMSGVAARWDEHAGSHSELLARLSGLIAERAPTAIVTFDPAHGSTCHPAHRTVAALVEEAAAQMASPPPVYLIETRVEIEATSLRVTRGIQYARSLVIFDTTTSWHYASEAARLHATQFAPAQIDSLSAPGQDRSIVLLPASAADSARYDVTCP